MRKLILLAFITFIFTAQPVHAGWFPCVIPCPEAWNERPDWNNDGLPDCCVEGERYCSADGKYRLDCGDYDWDACLEFPTDIQADALYCEYGCTTSTFGAKNLVWGECRKASPDAGSCFGCSLGEYRCASYPINEIKTTKQWFWEVKELQTTMIEASVPCVADEYGCTGWGTPEDPGATLCIKENGYSGCVGGVCVTEEEERAQECIEGKHYCIGDYWCGCYDRNKDGWATLDRPQDNPTTCRYCSLGCIEGKGCNTENGEPTECMPQWTTCIGDYVQRCSNDGKWIPIDYRNDKPCPFGCDQVTGTCNPDPSPNQQTEPPVDKCDYGATRCVNNWEQQTCDNSLGDETWSWGSVKVCESARCQGGKCRDATGAKVIYTLDEDLWLSPPPYENTPYKWMLGLTSDGQYLYTLTFNYTTGTWENLTILTLDFNGTIIYEKSLDLVVQNKSYAITDYFGTYRCGGGIAMADGNFYIGTKNKYNTTWLYIISSNGDIMNNITLKTNSGASICGMDIYGDYLYVLWTKDATNPPYESWGEDGGLRRYYLNGTIDSSFGTRCLVAKDLYWHENDSLRQNPEDNAEVCIENQHSLKVVGDRFYVIKQNYLGWSHPIVDDRTAHLEAYGLYDGAYYGKVADVTVDIPNDYAGIEKVGDRWYLIANKYTSRALSGIIPSGQDLPKMIVALKDYAVKQSECVNGSQKCVGFLFKKAYVDCIYNNFTGAWQWYQPQVINGSLDTSHYHQCDPDDICNEYWINHRIKKAECIDASCNNICVPGEKRCDPTNLWVETCVLTNTTGKKIIKSDGSEVTITPPATCYSWNRTEYCGGFYTEYGGSGYCIEGECKKRSSECKYVNSTHMDSRCIVQAGFDSQGRERLLYYVVNCTDIDNDGKYEFDMNNLSGLKTFCRWGCNQTFRMDYGNVSYAECREYSNTTIRYKNIVAEYTQWFRILFPDVLSRTIFSIFFIALIAGMLGIKGGWELGIGSAILLTIGFMAISFLPIYGLFIIVFIIGLYLFKEMST